MTEIFAANNYAFTNEGRSVEILFSEVDDETDEETHVFFMGGDPGFYFEYGDQGNGGPGNLVSKITLRKDYFGIVFKPEAQIVTWEYLMFWTPDQVRTSEQAASHILDELTINFNFTILTEVWEGMRASIARMTNGVCDFESRF